MFKEGQIVTGNTGTIDEYQKGLVLEVKGSVMLIQITEHEYDPNMVEEQINVMMADYRLISDPTFSIGSTRQNYTAPTADMNLALVLGII